MTTRNTSRAAYRQLVDAGLLVGKQAQCLDRLITMGQATSGEVLAAMGIENVNAWRARFTELQGRGLIVEAGQRHCKISGRLSVVWDATGRTQPLDLKRGARDGIGAQLKAWREIAKRLADALGAEVKFIEDGSEAGDQRVIEVRAMLAEYRKLAGK